MLKSAALVSGFTGQNGLYLVMQFLVKDYETCEMFGFKPAITFEFLNQIHRDIRITNPKLTFGNEDSVGGKIINNLTRIFDRIDTTA